MLHTVKSSCQKILLIVEGNTILLIRQNNGTTVIRCIFYVQRPYSVTMRSNCQCNQHFTWAANFQNWVGFFCEVRGDADKCLARPTSQCRRMESIVSLERRVCSCAECKSFLVTEAERKHVRRRARFQQHGDASCHQVFFSSSFLQGKTPKEIHVILTETLWEHALSYATVKKLGGPV